MLGWVHSVLGECVGVGTYTHKIACWVGTHTQGSMFNWDGYIVVGTMQCVRVGTYTCKRVCWGGHI